ncbi:inhibitor of growth protein 3-like [Actinia tenebrosa]|uniref:Inhibitor of growth protein n=1 Tax=Actinia tenebrosa TaxID=6105 RepID=A0A6P8II00_ACTTE|nr:inhibitor of growth protein 3-like [Actinia tenebrosa]
MLYLEDYLELIEQLPLELRERFTEMREMDLQVQNSIDDLDIRVKQFFMNCRKAKPEWKDQQYKQIKDEYQKSLEDAEEKVTIAGQIYDLVDKHLRKLDQELTKFKMELEADNAGITEVLEQRSLRLDEPIHPPSPMRNNHLTPSSQTFNSQKRKYSQVDVVSNDITNGEHSLLMPTYSSYSPLSSYTQMSPSPKVSTPQSPSPSISFTVGMLGAGSNAAAHAMSNTVQMQQSRRVGNALKTPYGTSYKGNTDYLGTGLGVIPSSSSAGNINGLQSGSFETPSPMPPSLTMPVTPVEPQTQLTVPTATSSQRKTKKNKLPSQMAEAAPASAQVAAQDAAEAAAAVPEWFYDPDEPRYCLCNQVSYGEMVGCDNPDCAIEWFHYGCVGLTDAPKGKWYCPQCATQLKQKRSRHK